MAWGFPVIAGLMWLYIYGLLPYGLVRSEAVPAGILPLAQFLSFAAYASLLIGWNVRLHRKSAGPASRIPTSFDVQKLSLAGVGLCLVGLVGHLTFHSSEQAYADSSAYWYLLFHLCYPGISLCVATMAISPSVRRLQNLVLAALLASPVVISELLGTRRGPTFVAIIAVAYSYLLVRRRLPRPAVLAAFRRQWGPMLFLVTARAVVVHNGSWSEVLSTISISDVFEHARDSHQRQ